MTTINGNGHSINGSGQKLELKGFFRYYNNMTFINFGMISQDAIQVEFLIVILRKNFLGLVNILTDWI